MTGGSTTTPTGPTSPSATSRRQSSLVGGGWRMNPESHSWWTDERGPVTVSAPEAVEIDHSKQEVMRRRFEEQAKTATKKASLAPTEGQPSQGFNPWREVITPHPDVAS